MKSRAGAWLRLQFFVFTISVTILSRLFIAGGKLLRRNRLRIRKRGTHRVRTTFPSGGNVIDAKLVQPVSDSRAAVLICHGIGETIWHWKGVQRLLAQNGVASLMFSYSGWGRSTGELTFFRLKTRIFHGIYTISRNFRVLCDVKK